MDTKKLDFDFERTKTSEFIENIDKYRELLFEEYDKAIEFLETNIIKKHYPDNVYLEYPVDISDKVYPPYSQYLDKYEEELSLSDIKVVFPIIISGDNRDVELGSLSVICEDIESQVVRIALSPNKKLPRSYRNFSSISIPDINLDIDTNKMLFDCLYSNDYFMRMSCSVNDDRYLMKTLSAYSLPFLHDIRRMEAKSAAVIPYIKSHIRKSGFQSAIKNSMDVWIKSKISSNVYCEVELSWLFCMIKVVSDTEIGCSFLYNFNTHKGDIQWYGRERRVSVLGQQLMKSRNELSDFAVNTVSYFGDICLNLFYYTSALEVYMEDCGYGHTSPDADINDLSIDMSQTEFPKDVWKDYKIVRCLSDDPNKLKSLVADLENYTSSHEEFSRFEIVEYLYYDDKQH